MKPAEIADPNRADATAKSLVGGFYFCCHSTGSNSAGDEVPRRFYGQALVRRTVGAAHPFYVRHEQKLVCPERDRDGSGGIVAVHVQRSTFRILYVTPDRRDHGHISGVDDESQQVCVDSRGPSRKTQAGFINCLCTDEFTIFAGKAKRRETDSRESAYEALVDHAGKNHAQKLDVSLGRHPAPTYEDRLLSQCSLHRRHLVAATVDDAQ